jgi:hypothetical protein
VHLGCFSRAVRVTPKFSLQVRIQVRSSEIYQLLEVVKCAGIVKVGPVLDQIQIYERDKKQKIMKRLILLVPPAGIGPAAHGLGTHSGRSNDCH